MVFSSIEFLLFFLPLFLIIYSITPKRIKNMTLLSGSLIFYAYGELRYLPLLLLSIAVNYFFGLHVGRREQYRTEAAEAETGLEGRIRTNRVKTKLNKRRRNVFIVAILYNVGMLAAFKYGKGGAYLPLGISFYTFQILSYLIDVYRGEQRKELSFLRFATYISMFPQLLSGPIVHYGEVRKEIISREFTAKGLQEGLKVFTLGLAAKVLLADRVGLLWQEVQVTGFESISTPLAWLAAAAYSLKIYFDFYGYSLMAMGLGRMLGFTLPENFRNPYMATSVRDFYRRWHMTLGRWFRENVYIPLGGNRKGEYRTVCHLLAVWFLTSVWHGSTVNFLVWGMLLWLAIVTERQLEALGVTRVLDRGPGKLLSRLYVWAYIPITWVCFAVTDIGQLQVFLGRMFHLIPGIRVSPGDWHKALTNYGMLFLAGAIASTPFLQKLFRRFKDSWILMILLAVLFWVCVWRLQREGQNPFMYLGF
ncbi:MAG: MBOAT family protein [Lachnospiraceae bacterium]|nr:MBOAT family protein [Lachnospiraceae bacterium]